MNIRPRTTSMTWEQTKFLPWDTISVKCRFPIQTYLYLFKNPKNSFIALNLLGLTVGVSLVVYGHSWSVFTGVVSLGIIALINYHLLQVFKEIREDHAAQGRPFLAGLLENIPPNLQHAAMHNAANREPEPERDY